MLFAIYLMFVALAMFASTSSTMKKSTVVLSTTIMLMLIIIGNIIPTPSFI